MALWEFGQASLWWDLDWRTTPPGPNKPTFTQAPVATMSLPTTPDQLGLVTTIDIYPGGRSECVPCIDHVPHPRGWSAWPVS